MSADQPGLAASDTADDLHVAPLADPGTNGNGSGRRRGRFLTTDDDVTTEKAPASRRAAKDAKRNEARLRARRTRRVVRQVDTWTVLKVSLVFYLCLFAVLMVAGVVIWNVASAAGTLSSIESFVKDAGAFKTFTFDGLTVFKATFLIGLICVVAATAITVLLAVLFNLISDLVGGVRFLVIEEETARPVPVETEVSEREAASR